MDLTFRLSLRSDYHVGSGHGLGDRADSALLRDDDGVPPLRGTMLTGLLRDALLKLCLAHPQTALACCAGSMAGAPAEQACRPENSAPCPVCRLFGSPLLPKRWRIGTARPVGSLNTLSAAWGQRIESAQIVQRVRINPRTRRAEAQKLFSHEEGDQRLVFEFKAHSLSHDVSPDDAALLVAAARLVRNLGRSRRRGNGECLLSLADAKQQEELLERFENRWLLGKPAATSPAEGRPAIKTFTISQPQASETSAPVRFRVIARLDEPVVAPGHAESGNQFETREVITGSALLGALARLAARRWALAGSGGDQEARGDFLRLFRRGGLSLSTLLPTARHKDHIYPTIPSPRDLFSCELHPAFEGPVWEAHDAFGFATARDEPGTCQHNECADKEVALKPVGGFLRLGTPPRLFEPRTREELHIRMNPRTQRVQHGALFGYTAIAAGEFFLGELECRDASAWNQLRELAGIAADEGHGADGFIVALSVGRANRRGYGRMTLHFQREVDDAKPSRWIGVDLDRRVPRLGDPLTLTLLTDTLLIDPWGRALESLEHAGSLEAALGLKQLGARLKILNWYSRSDILDGFNNRLGLPRWRDHVLLAGSAVGLRLDGEYDDGQARARLRESERSGIGLRREEGLGRIAFNHPVYRGGVGLPPMSIELPESMRLESTNPEAIHEKEASFRALWGRKLRDRIKKDEFADGNWLAVARWLSRHADQEPDWLKERLATWGRAENRLGPQFYRDKPNFFEKEPHKQGRQVLEKLLENLNSDTEPGPVRVLGVRMLANRLAELAAESENS